MTDARNGLTKPRIRILQECFQDRGHLGGMDSPQRERGSRTDLGFPPLPKEEQSFLGHDPGESLDPPPVRDLSERLTTCHGPFGLLGGVQQGVEALAGPGRLQFPQALDRAYRDAGLRAPRVVHEQAADLLMVEPFSQLKCGLAYLTVLITQPERELRL